MFIFTCTSKNTNDQQQRTDTSVLIIRNRWIGIDDEKFNRHSFISTTFHSNINRSIDWLVSMDNNDDDQKAKAQRSSCFSLIRRSVLEPSLLPLRTMSFEYSFRSDDRWWRNFSLLLSLVAWWGCVVGWPRVKVTVMPACRENIVYAEETEKPLTSPDGNVWISFDDVRMIHYQTYSHWQDPTSSNSLYLLKQNRRHGRWRRCVGCYLDCRANVEFSKNNRSSSNCVESNFARRENVPCNREIVPWWIHKCHWGSTDASVIGEWPCWSERCRNRAVWRCIVFCSEFSLWNSSVHLDRYRRTMITATMERRESRHRDYALSVHRPSMWMKALSLSIESKVKNVFLFLTFTVEWSACRFPLSIALLISVRREKRERTRERENIILTANPLSLLFSSLLFSLNTNRNGIAFHLIRRQIGDERNISMSFVREEFFKLIKALHKYLFWLLFSHKIDGRWVSGVLTLRLICSEGEAERKELRIAFGCSSSDPMEKKTSVRTRPFCHFLNTVRQLQTPNTLTNTRPHRLDHFVYKQSENRLTSGGKTFVWLIRGGKDDLLAN